MPGSASVACWAKALVNGSELMRTSRTPALALPRAASLAADSAAAVTRTPIAVVAARRVLIDLEFRMNGLSPSVSPCLPGGPGWLCVPPGEQDRTCEEGRGSVGRHQRDAVPAGLPSSR